MSLRDNLKPYTIEAIQRLGGRGKRWQILHETIKILDREGKLGYVDRTELLKEEGILENGDGFWRLTNSHGSLEDFF